MRFTSPQFLLPMLFSVALCAGSLPAATLAHWTFDSFPPDTRIDQVTSEGITLAAGLNGMPKASGEVPSAGKTKGSAVFAPAGGTGSHLVSAEVLPALSFGPEDMFTIEGWFCLDVVNDTKAQTIISNRGLPDGITVSVNRGGTFLFQVQAGGGPLLNLEGKTVLQPNTWYFFAVTRARYGILGASLHTADGKLVEATESVRTADGAIRSNSRTYIGRRGERQGAGDFFNGKISEIRISNTLVSRERRLFVGE